MPKETRTCWLSSYLVVASTTSKGERLNSLADNIITVILAADADKQVSILHSPKNFGGTRMRPSNKNACLLGSGPRESCALFNQATALNSCKMATPTLEAIKARGYNPCGHRRPPRAHVGCPQGSRRFWQHPCQQLRFHRQGYATYQRLCSASIGSVSES